MTWTRLNIQSIHISYTLRWKSKIVKGFLLGLVCPLRTAIQYSHSKATNNFGDGCFWPPFSE